jgi:hypothetical protein
LTSSAASIEALSLTNSGMTKEDGKDNTTEPPKPEGEQPQVNTLTKEQHMELERTQLPPSLFQVFCACTPSRSPASIRPTPMYANYSTCLSNDSNDIFVHIPSLVEWLVLEDSSLHQQQQQQQHTMGPSSLSLPRLSATINNATLSTHHPSFTSSEPIYFNPHSSTSLPLSISNSNATVVKNQNDGTTNDGTTNDNNDGNDGNDNNDNNDDDDDNNDNNDQLSSEQRQTRFDALPQLPLTFDPPVVQAGKLFVKVLEAKHLPVSVCHLNTVSLEYCVT